MLIFPSKSGLVAHQSAEICLYIRLTLKKGRCQAPPSPNHTLPCPAKPDPTTPRRAPPCQTEPYTNNIQQKRERNKSALKVVILLSVTTKPHKRSHPASVKPLHRRNTDCRGHDCGSAVAARNGYYQFGPPVAASEALRAVRISPIAYSTT